MSGVPPDRGGFIHENQYDSLGEEEAGEIRTFSNTNNTRTRNNNGQDKRRKKFYPWDLSPTLFQQTNIHEGKYIILETTEGKPILELSTFTVEAILSQVAPNYISADRIRDGRILILTKDKKSADRALKMTNIPNICKIKVTEHLGMNRTQGSVFNQGLVKEDLEQMKLRLAGQGVVEIRRVTKFVNKIVTATPLHIITFNLSTLPETIKIGWENFSIRKYYPSPLRCSKCLVLGHTKKYCTEKVEFCKGCASERHEGPCPKKACRNCPNADHSSDNTCPKWEEEKAVIQIKTDMKIPHFKARMEYRKRLQKASQNAETTKVIEEQQEMYRKKTFAQVTGHDAVQQQILKTLELLQNKIEKLEKNMNHRQKKKDESKRKNSTSWIDYSSVSDAEVANQKIVHPPKPESKIIIIDETNDSDDFSDEDNITSNKNYENDNRTSTTEKTNEKIETKSNVQHRLIQLNEKVDNMMDLTTLNDTLKPNENQDIYPTKDKNQTQIQQQQPDNSTIMEYEDTTKGIKRTNRH